MAESGMLPARWRRSWPPVTAALVLMLAGCAELRTPPPNAAPAALAPGAADPTRTMIAAAASDFVDRGNGLANRPREAALAAARLEWLTDRVTVDPALRLLGGGIAQDLALARNELRDALGVAETAPAATVVAWLLGAARALGAGDATAAGASLPAPLFRPGGEGSVARLGTLGPMPQAALATQRMAEALARRDAAGGNSLAAPRTGDPLDRVTFGLGGGGPDGAAF